MMHYDGKPIQPVFIKVNKSTSQQDVASHNCIDYPGEVKRMILASRGPVIEGDEREVAINSTMLTYIGKFGQKLMETMSPRQIDDGNWSFCHSQNS